jgi:hypothetical protein
MNVQYLHVPNFSHSNLDSTTHHSKHVLGCNIMESLTVIGKVGAPWPPTRGLPPELPPEALRR